MVILLTLCLCITCVQYPKRLEEGITPVQGELQGIVRHYVGAENWICILCMNNKSLKSFHLFSAGFQLYIYTRGGCCLYVVKEGQRNQ